MSGQSVAGALTGHNLRRSDVGGRRSAALRDRLPTGLARGSERADCW